MVDTRLLTCAGPREKTRSSTSGSERSELSVIPRASSLAAYGSQNFARLESFASRSSP
jgi:hypothetical protein